VKNTKKQVINNLIQMVVALVIALGAVSPALMVRAAPTAYSAWDLIAAVNEMRAGQGLPPLVINAALMNSAQAHSEYQASIGTWTHEGPGGSTPTTRAVAAGYGGGATIFISENVAQMLESGTLQTLIYDLWSDQAHWNTMTNPQYIDVGAGVAVSNGRVYYTLDVGVVWGEVQPTQPGANTPVPPAATQPLLMTSTPNPDGSVMHVVAAGQTLWTIATAYGLTVAQLKEINKLLSDSVFVGDRLMILPSFTPTLSPTNTETSRPPTRTATPTRTPRTPTLTPTGTQTLTPTSAPFINLEGLNRQTLGLVILIVSGLGVAFVAVGSLLRRKPAVKRSESSTDYTDSTDEEKNKEEPPPDPDK
jgi:uncharacterized protein YkwD